MPAIDRDGTAIYYESHGAGPAVLLSHGYGATCRMWDGQIAAFSDRYPVIVWNARAEARARQLEEKGMTAFRGAARPGSAVSARQRPSPARRAAY